MNPKKIYIVLLVCFTLFSCNSQQISKKDLYGNWYTLRNEEFKELTYTEIYIDENRIFYYTDNIGLKPPSNYSIEGNYLYHSRLGSTKEKIGKLYKENNFITIESKENSILLDKIDDSVNLEKLINGEISEEKFREGFLNRLDEWNKLID